MERWDFAPSAVATSTLRQRRRKQKLPWRFQQAQRVTSTCSFKVSPSWGSASFSTERTSTTPSKRARQTLFLHAKHEITNGGEVDASNPAFLPSWLLQSQWTKTQGFYNFVFTSS